MAKRTIAVKVFFDESEFLQLSRSAMARDRKPSELLHSWALDRMFGDSRRFGSDSVGTSGAVSSLMGQDED